MHVSGGMKTLSLMHEVLFCVFFCSSACDMSIFRGPPKGLRFSVNRKFTHTVCLIDIKTDLESLSSISLQVVQVKNKND